MKAVKVSVIIPVYNAEKYLSQCLESVLNQSLRELEVICVDDGSTDHSPDIMAEFTARDSRVRVFHQENQYAGTARNRGMAAAQGNYLAFLDADDYYLPGALEGLYCLAQRHGLDMVKGRFHLLNVNSGQRSMPDFARNRGVPCGKLLAFRRYPTRLLNAADVPWNGLYRRAFVEGSGIQFNRLQCVNDRSFYIHCLLEAQRIIFSRQEVACYRVAQSGSLIGRKARHFQDQLDSYAIIRGLCQAQPAGLRQAVLRQELSGVLGWYERLQSEAPDPEALDAQVVGFLKRYEEADVDVAYLAEFPYRRLYYRMRYDKEPPGRRPPLPVRVARCWREHGGRYTLDRLCSHITGGRR